jgi:hypothetical protein
VKSQEIQGKYETCAGILNVTTWNKWTWRCFTGSFLFLLAHTAFRFINDEMLPRYLTKTYPTLSVSFTFTTYDTVWSFKNCNKTFCRRRACASLHDEPHLEYDTGTTRREESIIST